MNRTLKRDITDEQMRAYDEDGVVLIRGALDEEWVERAREAMERCYETPTPWGQNVNAEGTPGRMLFDIYMWTQDPDLRALAFESPLPQIVATLMRSNTVNLLWDFHILKEPHSDYPTDWHHDQPADPCNGWQACGTWVPFDYVTLESGALEYIKGSHKWDRWFDIPGSSVRDGDAYFKGYTGEEPPPPGTHDHYEEMLDFANLRDRHEILHFDTEPGDCLIHHLMMMHYAPGNTTDRRRRTIGHKFVGDDATYAVREGRFRVLPPWDPEIKNGDRFPAGDHSIYPRVWPRRAGADKSRAAE